MAKKKQNTTELTPIEYSKLRGYKNRKYVNKLLADNSLDQLPGVIGVRMFGRFRILTVAADQYGKPEVPRLTDLELLTSRNRSKARLNAGK